MKFKAGDYVKIKEGLKESNTEDFITYMEQYCGKETEVTEIRGNYYKLGIDKEEFYWSDDMLEPLHEEYRIIVEGNKITVTDGFGKEGTAKCCPEDKFDLATGISLAIDRLTGKPNKNECYWTVDFSQPDYVYKYKWVNDNTDNEYFKNGVIFKTREEAIEVAKKMLEVI